MIHGPLLPALVIMTKEIDQTTHSIDDIERNAADELHLNDNTIRSLVWRGITVQKRGWMTDARPIPILSKINGYAEAGTLTQ